ncbi:MAG: HD domain-containing protein, partial [Chthonomonadaceae bacterium]|nr:HD domain-containing protein [Chthonomonadaceae bacterium]
MYFEGAFLLDQQTQDQQQEKIWRMLAFILFASLATVIAVYPIVLLLYRSLLKASKDILRGNLEIASVLGTAIAKRDSDTGEHNYRVTLYAIRLAEAVNLPMAEMRSLILGAFLHDVGKIGIPDAILLKPGRLSETEFAAMRKHVELGLDIVAPSHWLLIARDIIGKHHEKYDGSGYPLGLCGEAIPLTARIFAIVDVFDALTSHRPYKVPMPVEDAVSILLKHSGQHFDPALVGQFTRIVADIHAEICAKSEAELAEKLGQLLP